MRDDSRLDSATASTGKALDESTIISREWRGYIGQLATLAEEIAALSPGSHDDQWRKELYQFLYSQISVGYLSMFSDPQYPEFMSYYNHIYAQGFPNPDDTLNQAIIADDGVYRISGNRGTSRLVIFQFLNEIGAVTRMIKDAEDPLGGSAGVYDIDELTIAPDGSLDVILSPTRPEGYEGDWWKLTKGGTALVVRQRHYDWVNEVDARLAIERLDIPARRPRPTAEEIDESISRIAKYIRTYGKITFDSAWTEHLRTEDHVNQVVPKDYADKGGLENQRFVEGFFNIRPDEALIIESELPEDCSYWGFHLTDDFWQSIDWMHHQSNLNGYTARIDSDGKLRIVVSLQDPGVPNWLDTVGRTKGFIYGRWTRARTNPTPKVTKVNISEVRDYLPADTPMVTAQERDETIRKRRKGVQMRKRW